MKHLIAPSILAANFGQLQTEIEMVNSTAADWLHVDVMDGRFVPNISFGFPVIKAMKQHSTLPLDVHLMIVEPEKYLEQFKNIGADILTVHYEVSPHLHRTVQAIKELGMKAGVALNPHTPVCLLADILNDIDLVCLMSVNPGFGGQSFIPNTLNKIRELKNLIIQKKSSALIEIDGGVKRSNAAAILKAGADVLVAGSSVFKAPDPVETVLFLKKISSDAVVV